MIFIKSKNLFKQTFQRKDTVGTVISDSESAVKTAISSLENQRKQLEKYVRKNPEFLYSLEPVRVDEVPRIARLMAEAGVAAGVGPMAAVAGVLCDLAVEAMVLTGSKVAVVEDGGEAYVVSDRSIDVALLAGDSPLSKQIGFRLEAFPVGLATSSGVFSHALSFGDAEAVTVFAETAGLADAAATATGNVVKGDDVQGAIGNGVNRALSIRGVKGVFILYRGTVGKAGQIPKMVKISGQTPLSP
jgi:ApbE superfamily uncharacterized protein (UPF0280 family)